MLRTVRVKLVNLFQVTVRLSGPMWTPRAVLLARSVTWLDDVKHDLNQAFVSLGLVLLMSAVFINCCLVCLCCHLVVVIFVVLVPA